MAYDTAIPEPVAKLRDNIDLAVRTRFYCLTGRWLTDDERGNFTDLVAYLIVSEIRQMTDAAETVSMMFDQESDDGWRSWMRKWAAQIEASCKDDDED